MGGARGEGYELMSGIGQPMMGVREAGGLGILGGRHGRHGMGLPVDCTP